MTVSDTVINTFICPSDGDPPTAPNSRQWFGNTTNYFASWGTTTDPGPTTAPGSSRTGVVGVQAITDGTSNTIAFGEDSSPTDTGTSSRRGGLAGATPR